MSGVAWGIMLATHFARNLCLRSMSSCVNLCLILLLWSTLHQIFYSQINEREDLFCLLVHENPGAKSLINVIISW